MESRNQLFSNMLRAALDWLKDRDAKNLIREKLGILPPEELKQRCFTLGAVLQPSNADLCAEFHFLPNYPIWLKSIQIFRSVLRFQRKSKGFPISRKALLNFFFCNLCNQ